MFNLLSEPHTLGFFQVIRDIATFVLKVKILCYLSELDDYVVVVSTFRSRSGNQFFDVKLKVAENKTVTVGILKQANQTLTEAYLKSLRQEGEPVKLKSFKNPKRNVFLNNSRGSTIERTNSVNFSFDNKHFQNVSFIKTQKTGIFDILATVKWLHNMKQIDSPKVKRRLREAVLYDDRGSIF